MAISILSHKSSPAKPSDRLVGGPEGFPAFGRPVAFCGGSRCYTPQLHSDVAGHRRVVGSLYATGRADRVTRSAGVSRSDGGKRVATWNGRRASDGSFVASRPCRKGNRKWIREWTGSGASVSYSKIKYCSTCRVTRCRHEPIRGTLGFPGVQRVPSPHDGLNHGFGGPR